MYKGKKILTIIPARGGSKGLPKKNIRPLLGKPLIFWTIENALNQQIIDDIVVSTDDIEISNISKDLGVSIPFLRPTELAQDDTPIYNVIEHLLTSLKEQYDIVALMEPTSPLRTKYDVTNALKLLVDNYESTDAVISVGEVHTENPFICKILSGNFIKPFISSETYLYQRQQLPPTYFPYGVIYGAKVDSYLKEKSFYLHRAMPYHIQRWQNYEIDDIYDFLAVENIMKYKRRTE